MTLTATFKAATLSPRWLADWKPRYRRLKPKPRPRPRAARPKR
ncbi:MAG: hypothetical protein ACKVW3_09610 [Phycisphaerales bacterium]